MKKVVVIGAGGHSHSVCDIMMQDSTIEIVGLIDRDPSAGFFGINVIGCDDDMKAVYEKRIAEYAFVAIGSNKLRKKLTMMAEDIGFKMINAVSPYAVISPNASVGKGVAVMAGAVINAGARIGDGAIINTNSSVDHDTVIGEFVHVAPGCAVCGTVSVGNGTFIGVGSSVIDGISIGNNVMIGAGGAVVKDIPSDCTAVGVPARVIKYNN